LAARAAVGYWISVLFLELIMDQGNPSDSERLAGPVPLEHSGSQPGPAHSSAAVRSETAQDRIALLQRAFLLEQLSIQGAGSRSAGALNKQITAAARRELQLNADAANRARRELAQEGYLEVHKDRQKVFYALTESGRTYLAGLERPVLSGPTKPPAPVDEAAISDEVREAQIAYLLLQLLDENGQPLAKGEANKFKNGPHTSLGLKPAIANHRRAKLAERGYIRITRAGRSEEYVLTPDGLDYLAANTRHLKHATFKLKGQTLNALVAAARESSFQRDRPAGPTPPERPVPSQSELAEAVLAEFQQLRRERHGRSGLVPIHEVRQRIADRFTPAAARHDVLDEVILGLWRQQRLGLEAISDLAGATEQQLNDSIRGVHGTLFYLEAPHEQPVASESL
jgi:DNA-binding PadR family transcriptional regulator